MCVRRPNEIHQVPKRAVKYIRGENENNIRRRCLRTAEIYGLKYARALSSNPVIVRGCEKKKFAKNALEMCANQ